MLFVTLLYLFLININCNVNCSAEEEKLIKNLFKGYNKLIRPVRNSSDHVNITMDLTLLQLINVYEKEQIMKTNVWVNLKWTDFQLIWSRSDYNVVSIRMPYDRIWTPDIVLFNNADGNYEASYKSNAVIYADQAVNILLVPPAIYKSSCTIDVTYFPFDEQWCEMRFGSWTFDANQVRLVPEKSMANLADYLPSGTWDVIEAPSETSEYVVDGIKRMELVYKFRIRRKTLFYTVNLIIPTVLISFLSIFVFYLPTDEGEKMTLCISILLALVVFLLLVSKILPPTSIVIPLIAKYLLFTLIMNIVTILNTVIIINWNYRTPRTHNMPRWVRLVFTEFLPKVLFMQRQINTDNNSSSDSEINTTATETSINNNNKNNSKNSINLNHKNLYSSTNKLTNSMKLLNLTDSDFDTATTANHDNTTNYKNTNLSSITGGNIKSSYNKTNNVLSTATQKSQKTLNQHFQNVLTIENTSAIDNMDINAKPATPKSHQKQQQHLYLSNHTVKRVKKNQSVNNDTNILTNDDIIVNNRVSNNNNCIYNTNSMKRSNHLNRNYDKYQTKSRSFDSDLLDEQTDSYEEFSQEVLDAADKVAYITNHIKSENDYQEVRDDWKYVALVIDRLQLCIFFFVTVIGTVCILLRAPHIFDFVDQQEILKKMRDSNNS